MIPELPWYVYLALVPGGIALGTMVAGFFYGQYYKQTNHDPLGVLSND